MIKCKYLIVYSKNSRGLKTVTVRNNQNHYCSNFFIKDLTIDICQRGSYFKLKINCRSILRKQWIKPVTIDTCQRFLNSIKGKNLWTFLFHSDTKCNGIHDFTSTVALTDWNFNLIACKSTCEYPIISFEVSFIKSAVYGYKSQRFSLFRS